MIKKKRFQNVNSAAVNIS